MSASAPSAMYLVVSVLPSSTTSGGEAANAASSLVKWSAQVWYWTSTFTPGFLALKAAVAAATSFGQPVCASVCNQTVNVPLAAAAGVEAAAAGVEAAAAGVEAAAAGVDAAAAG